MRPDDLPFRPLIIIGAGRSGTNILRDALCALPGFATWPCDEINPIMRHGNIAMRHDRFDAAQARPVVARFIRKAFQREWQRQGRPAFLVEKTCANSLRVPFLAGIFPEARFVFLHRHGGDVLASARKRWRGEMELPTLPYYWSKVRFTPLRDLPIYGWRFLRSRAQMLTGQAEHMANWGPTSPAMLELPRDASLDLICARQWADCVMTAQDDLAMLDARRVYRLAYEDFVSRPATALKSLAAFAEADVTPQHCAAAAANVRTSSVGKGAAALASANDEVIAIVRPVLDRLGYSD
jgi:hypothetical protein